MYTHTDTFIDVHTHTHTHTRTHAFKDKRIHMRTRKHIYIGTQKCTHMLMHTETQSDRPTHMGLRHTFTDAHMQTKQLPDIGEHTHTHTYYDGKYRHVSAHIEYIQNMSGHVFLHRRTFTQ